jgi:hypothetical protein
MGDAQTFVDSVGVEVVIPGHEQVLESKGKSFTRVPSLRRGRRVHLLNSRREIQSSTENLLGPRFVNLCLVSAWGER